MTVQPIYGENGDIVDTFDTFDDGDPDPVAVEPPPTEAVERNASDDVAPPWAVPQILQGANDLFIGMTIHQDDGDSRGVLISLLVREQPDGVVKAKTFRAAELSQTAFLDNLQRAIASTMQVYLLARQEQQRKKRVEEEKRKARQPLPQARVSSAATPVPTQPQTPPTREIVKSTEKKPEQKYTQVSMF